MTGLRERFDEKWIPHPRSGCWIWTARTEPNGYGKIHDDGRRGRQLWAHRVSYELRIEPIPAGMQLDHLCRHRRCVNPAHLEPVTNRENGRRGDADWRKYRTHCPRGHAFDEANTALHRVRERESGFKRVCRACRALRRRERTS